MIIRTLELPSTGWKSELPPEMEMRPLGGRQTRLIAQGIEQKSMLPIFEALQQCFDVDVSALSIPDAYYLVFIQRMRTAHIKPLVYQWTCKKPVYEYTDGASLVLREDRSPLLVRPCDQIVKSAITPDSVIVRKLQSTHDRFDIPRLSNYEQASSSTFDWAAAHLNRDIRAAIAELETRIDLTLWTELSDWISASQHGIHTGISCTCDSCSRDTDSDWTFGAEIFA